MGVVKCLGHFQFDQKRIFNQKVSKILTEDRAVISDVNGLLTCNGNALVAEFERQRIFVDFLEKSNAKRVQDSPRATNDDSR